MFKKSIHVITMLFMIFSLLIVADVSPKETNNTIKNELKVKRKQVVNDDGSITITITYQVLPEEATDKNVTLSLSWSDSSLTDDVNDYLSLEHNASNFSWFGSNEYWFGIYDAPSHYGRPGDTIIITGGEDVTNPDLIAWLQENATLQ